LIEIAGWALQWTKLDGFYLAEERGGKLVYTGKIEGGWTEAEKNDLLARIKPYKQRNAPIELSAEYRRYRRYGDSGYGYGYRYRDQYAPRYSDQYGSRYRYGYGGYRRYDDGYRRGY
jgi:hypothetical protein